MATFRWDVQFETGLPEVDAQHRHLVDILVGLSARLEKEAAVDPADLAPVYAELVDYSRYHFQTEERLQSEVGLDARHVLHHVREHTDFVRQVQALLARPSADPGADARRLVDFLVHWLTYHILGSDHAMARQIRLVRAGKGAEDAFAEAERAIDPATATLLRSVQALFDVLSHRNRELMDLAESLEQRVAERTTALTAANAELKALVERVEQMAMTDMLTGLPNRRYAMERLGRALASAMRQGTALSCLLVDADGFKQVNDTYGHEAGDEVLKSLARELRRVLRESDDVCRLGGDEFLVIAPDTPPEGALALGERLRRSVAALRVVAGAGSWKGSISVGVATRTSELTVEGLLRAADEAVYAAKRAGRNAVRSAADLPVPELLARG
jgi:hemerythrin